MISSTPWRDLGDRLTARYAQSTWRLPVLVILTSLAFFTPLYFLRGFRLVQIGVLGSVAAAGAVLAFSRPFPTLLLAVFVLASGLDLMLPGPVGLGLLSIVLARIGYDGLDGKRIDWGTPRFRWSLVILLAICLGSLTVVRKLEFALIELRNLGLGVAVYVAVAGLVTSTRRIVPFFVAVVVGLAVASLLPLRGLLSSGNFATLALALATRVGGEGLDPNLHAGNLNCTLPLLFAAVVHLRGWRRWIMVGLLPVFIGSIILSQSRAGVALLVLSIAVLLLRAGRIGRGVAIGGGLGLVAVVMWLPQAYWVRFASLGQLSHIVVDRSLLIRRNMLHIGLEIFRQHPWFGVGLGNLRVETPHYMLGGFMAHNSYLEVAGGVGIFGLIAYLVWIGSGFGMAWHASRTWSRAGAAASQNLADAILIGLGLFCLTAATLSVPYSLFLFILLALANAARRCADQDTTGAPGVVRLPRTRA
jgi:O-antigen ligase